MQIICINLHGDGGADQPFAIRFFLFSTLFMTGTIKKILPKGFGFIAAEGMDKDYFFHLSGCVTPFDTLQEGQKVQFETEQSPKGERAIRVTAIESGTSSLSAA